MTAEEAEAKEVGDGEGGAGGRKRAEETALEDHCCALAKEAVEEVEAAGGGWQ